MPLRGRTIWFVRSLLRQHDRSCGATRHLTSCQPVTLRATGPYESPGGVRSEMRSGMSYAVLL